MKDHPYRKKIKQILIVEDEAIIGMALAADLEDMGFEVQDVVSTGKEALKVMQENPADLLILDLKLGNGLDGIETLSKIRELADPMVIIISGNSEIITISQVKKMNIDGFLVKPVNVTELRELLDTIQQPPVN